MRIAIITPVFPPYRGGIGKIAELDARQLAELGHDITVHAPVKSAVPKTATTPYEVVPLQSAIKIGNAAFAPELYKIVRHYDAVILHYPFFGGAEFVALGKHFLKAGKLIIVYHMDVVGKGLLGNVFTFHSRFVMPRILRQADRVIVTTFDYARTGLVAPLVAAKPDRLVEMPPSVDIRRFVPGARSEQLVRRYGIQKDEKVVVCVGGLDKAHYFKGIPKLFEAMTASSLEKTIAVIVGDGDLRHDYKALAERFSIAKRVVFAGSVSDEALPDHYRLADAFVFPSVDRSEAFGIAALEALASGIPVVASDLPGVRTIVRDGVTGLLAKPEDAVDLAEKITRLLGDDALRSRMGIAGREMAEKEYTDDVRKEKWKRVIAEV